MWEVMFPLVTVGVGLWASLRYNLARLQGWEEAAVSCGLRLEETSPPWAWRTKVKARAGPVQVRIEDTLRKDRGTRIVVAVSGPTGFSRVRLRPETQRPWGVREIETGDEAFDTAFFVEGPLRLVGALLDREVRHLLITLNAECRLLIGGGELRAELHEFQVRDLLPLLCEAGRRFAQPLNIAQRLAENARGDPDAGVRLRNLLLLAREHPREPGTNEVLRAACSDPSPEVRLRAARELGAEARGVLFELAENTAADDAVSAQAVALLGRELPLDRTRAVLVHALRRRRLRTAHAALEALGGNASDAAVEMLAKVLAREKSELAAAAAEALGKTGNTAAEPPLIRALQHARTEVRVVAATALARIGSAAAVLPLKEAAESSSRDPELRRATRQAIAEIQSRLEGATPGQLSLAGDETGRLSLAPGEAGQLALANDPAGQLSISEEQ